MMKRQAFTLIELLVVIAVIAVLMAILMPALNLARDQGRKMACANNLHSLALANHLYARLRRRGRYAGAIRRTDPQEVQVPQ